jgi:hypothetical protein
VADAFGREQAEALLRAGWRQGALFAPNENIPFPPGANGEDNVLIVLTQSCTVVSERLNSDPVVEVAVAKLLKKFNAKDQAATGKSFRKLILPLEQGEEYKAIEIDINSRRLYPRDLLLGFAPTGPQISEPDARKIGGWMARYFSRVALPNALVEKMKGTTFELIKKVLKNEHEGEPLHMNTRSIFIGWEPDDEVGPYRVRITIVCSDQRATEAVDRLIIEASGAAVPDGAEISIDVWSADAIFVADLDGLVRLSEWDYLTDLGEPQI